MAPAFNRLIQKTLLNPLAKSIIEGEVRDGDVVRIDKNEKGDGIAIVDIEHEAHQTRASTHESDQSEGEGDVLEGEMLSGRY